MLAISLILCCVSLALSEYCNIPKVSLSEIDGQKALPEVPMIYTSAATRQHKVQHLASRDNLIENFGDMEVTLSSSNTYSHGRYTSTLEEYITTSVDTSSRFANESLYLFGNNYDGIFSELTSRYLNPPCYYCDVAGAKTIGIGGHASGVSFHFHGPGFSESIIGSKRWFLVPPSMTKLVSTFSPNMTVATWVDSIYPLLADLRNMTMEAVTLSSGASTATHISTDTSTVITAPTETLLPEIAGDHSALSVLNISASALREFAASLQECVIYPGEVLYFPPMWMHATLNLDRYNVFMSLFIDPQLMK